MAELPLYNKILVVLINLVGVWLAILVYQNNPKWKINKVFVFITMLMFFWVNFAFFAMAIGQDSISLLSLKIDWFVTPLFFILLYLLVIYLLKKEKEYQFLTKIVLFTGIGIAFITGFTNLIIEGIKFVDGNLVIIYGVGMLPFLE